ncbi:MAG: leucyl/phenylalanyl-tRNA--protein transferase [Flavobacteriaceae bacterium TMED81]|jgi:leucyl/phenylalanyl-tRNA--protein transferase|nr:MAG: leucyl/phenylalanyl-tRNA--protein transferase [Flavobacteriaceae bacterium TMED81]
MYRLTDALLFPSPEQASAEGIVAVGGDLQPERVMLAYRKGIFPWFESDDFLLWWSPDPRMVLFPDQLKISKSMRTVLRKKQFEVTFNKAFDQVVEACAKVKRFGQNGTWITPGLMEVYSTLHTQGHAHSVEVWEEGSLVGGLYGIDLGTVFCGESMFSKSSNASKVALIFLVKELKKNKYELIDCQVPTQHLASMGAEPISRTKFLTFLS